MPTASAFDDWAEFYDLIHQGVPGEAEFYVGQAVRTGCEVLELGCGTGRLAIPMALSGVDVVGLDNAREMLSVCVEKHRAVGPAPGKLRLIQADMTEFALARKFGLIIMAYRTFMHVLEPETQRRCLRCVHAHLEDGGVFIMNSWVPKAATIARNGGIPKGVYHQAGKYDVETANGAVTLWHYYALEYDETGQYLREDHVIHELTAEGKLTRTVSLPMTRAWTTVREMQHLLETAGFAVEALLGDFDCNPLTPDSTEMIWVARKS